MMARLGEIFTISSGGTPNKNEKLYYINGTIPWVKTGDLKDKYVQKGIECITEEGLNNSSAKLFPKDTVLVAMYGATIGACSILSYEASTNQACAALLPCKDVIPEYLFYFLSGRKDQFIKDGVGGAQPNISAGYLKNVEFELVSLGEQQKVIDRLSKVDDLISFRKQQLSKLDELVKARFVEMFGLPVSNTMNWETEKMQSIAPSQNYLGEMPDEVWLLNLDMIESQTGRIIDYLIVPKDEIGNSTCVFDDSTILYSKLRPYLNKVVIPNRCGYATSELVPLKPNSFKLNREYLAYMLRSDDFVTMISEKVAGAKMPRVSMNDFRNFEVPIPPIEVQNEFAAFVKQIDKSKFGIQQSLEKLETLKKSLMQQYFG